MKTTTLAAVLSALLGACDSSKNFTDGDADTDVDTDTDSDADTDTDTDTGGEDCDLLTGDPCAETENCSSDLSNQHQCIDAGEGVQGEACGTDADCARLHRCETAVCSRWCTAAGSECPEGSVCSRVVLGSDGTTEIGRLCKTTTDCDVLEQTGC